MTRLFGCHLLADCSDPKKKSPPRVAGVNIYIIFTLNQTIRIMTITVKMYDELNEVEVVRTIDGSNALVNDASAKSGWESHVVGNNEQIEKNLINWISERANDQHETILTLKSWELNR